MSDYGDHPDEEWSGGKGGGDDLSDDEIVIERDDYEEEPVRLDESKATLIMIDNVPVIGMDRYEKLCGVIRRLFNGYGTVVELFLPYDNDSNGVSKTLGYAFVEYETQEQAQRAVIEGNNKKLDAQHTLLVSSFDDYEKLSKISETFIPPKREDYENKANVGSWLLDANTRDQFLLRYANETQIYWFDPLRKLNENCRDYKYGGEREKANDKHWCEMYTEFSPKGNYLVTYHLQGIALWGGDQFERLGRFGHHNVQQILFSPCEKYIITSNITPLNHQQSTPSAAQEKEKILVWDLRKGKMLREFERKDVESSIINNNDNHHHTHPTGTIFKWSHDDKYFARRGKDKEGKEALFVYETPSMQLVDKKSIKMPGLQDFLWSPTENIISYWIPEQDNHPALVGVIEIPSRTIKREKHLYNVINVKMYWQDQGDYLCVKLLRKKTKKTTSTNLELFRMKTKEIPIEVLEIDYPVNSFAWEPGHNGGHRFAIIHGEPVAGKVSLSLYDAKKKIKLIKTFDQRSANSLFWSPAGSILVAAGLTNGNNDKMNGTLEWFDAEAGESVASSEHFMCNEVEWDPSGRYLLTAVTQPLNETNFKYGMESGYRMWTMHGQPLCSVPVESCYQAMWRPRPASLLSKEQLIKLKENLKEKYWKKFEQEDEEIRQTQLTGAAKERRELKQQWKQYRSVKEQEYQEEATERRELRGYDSDSDDNYVLVEQLVEEELGREEFVL